MISKALQRAGAAVSLLAIAHLAVPIAPAQAGVSQALSDFADDMGGAMNVSGPSAFQGQSAGYYSLGGVWARFPQKTTQLATLTLPQVRAGCGGIDVFTGSFSMINASEFVATLKAIANNAVGFAFQLAIDSLSPMIGTNIKDLMAKVREFTDQSINSCEAAASIIGNVWPQGDMADQRICEAIGTSSGLFSDRARARHKCGTGGARSSTNTAAGPEFKDVNPGVPVNYTWEALKKSSFVRVGGSFDKDFAQYVMTVVGTIVNVPPKDGGGGADGSVMVYPGQTTGRLIDVLLDGQTTGGTPVTFLSCDEPDKCLTVTQAPLLAPAPAAALKGRVKAVLDLMALHLSMDSAYSATDGQTVIGLVNATSIPIYKILAVEVASYGYANAGTIETLSELVAVDVLLKFLDETVSGATQASAAFRNASGDQLEQWRTSLYQTKAEIDRKRVGVSQRTDQVIGLTQRTQFLEATLANRLAPGLSASLNWSRGLGGGL